MGDILKGLGLMGGASANPEGLQTPQAPVPGADAIEVVGDSWKPKKQSFLQKLGDIVLERQGEKPLFKERLMEENYRSAMEGFQGDPEQAISRVRRLPGMADEAWKMYGQHRDDLRQEAGANVQRERLMEMRRDRIAQMMGSVNEGNAPKLLPLIKNLARKYEIDDDLPDSYDPDSINAWRFGSMKVDQQEDNERDEAYDDRRLDQYDASQQSQDEYRDAQVGVARDRLQETRRHHEVTEGQGAERLKNQQAKTPGVGKVLRDKNSGKVIGEVLPSGKYARVQQGDKTLIFKVLPGGGIKFDQKATDEVNE